MASSQTATNPVRFEFMCEKTQLKYTHPLPTTLLKPNSQQNPLFPQLFVQSITPILNLHEPACRSASSPTCGQECGSPTTKVLMTPMSWLHIPNDPFVNIFVNPVCANPECETKTRQSVQFFMEKMNQEAPRSGPVHAPKEVLELVPCGVCGVVERTSRCARCRVVAYCGKEHQKLDWPNHKKACRKAGR